MDVGLPINKNFVALYSQRFFDYFKLPPIPIKIIARKDIPDGPPSGTMGFFRQDNLDIHIIDDSMMSLVLKHELIHYLHYFRLPPHEFSSRSATTFMQIFALDEEESRTRQQMYMSWKQIAALGNNI